MLEQLAASELLPEQSRLDKALKEIIEKIDKSEKLRNLHGINFKGTLIDF